MIEDYLSAARRTKPVTEQFTNLYHKIYECIKSHVNPLGGYPDLFITYSSERRCELVELEGKQHLVYDQYLGQSFNRLNRIQFARHNPDMLSMAYACKFVAERLLTLNSSPLAILFALMNRQLENNSKRIGNPFSNLGEDERLRNNLISAQEIFVMGHEIAHYRWGLDQAALRAETATYLDEFLKFKDDSDHESTSSQPISDYYRAILDSAGPEFIEELFADHFGSIIALRTALTFNVRPWEASLGIILAFKYLRLFRHLEILSHRISSATKFWRSDDFHSSLKSIESDIWDTDTGSIKRFQLREHFLRYRLWADRKELPDHDPSKESKIIAVVGDYDMKTELPVTLGLTDRLTSHLTPDLLMELEKSARTATNASSLVDQLTGWQR